MNKAFACAALALCAGVARAELNIDLNTPPAVIVKHAMEQRSSRLVRFYDAGIIGLAKDGSVAVRDDSRLTLVQRQIAGKLVDAENEDRKWLTVAIADGSGKPEARPEARAALVKRWREQWKSGWYMQDDAGAWAKKP